MANSRFLASQHRRMVREEEVVNREVLPEQQQHSVDEVVTWLREFVGLPQYEACIRENHIDGRRMIHLTSASKLSQMGVTRFDHITRMTRCARHTLDLHLPPYGRPLAQPRQNPRNHFLLLKAQSGVNTDELTYTSYLRDQKLTQFYATQGSVTKHDKEWMSSKTGVHALNKWLGYVQGKDIEERMDSDRVKVCDVVRRRGRRDLGTDTTDLRTSLYQSKITRLDHMIAERQKARTKPHTMHHSWSGENISKVMPRKPDDPNKLKFRHSYSGESEFEIVGFLMDPDKDTPVWADDEEEEEWEDEEEWDDEEEEEEEEEDDGA